MTFKIEFLTHSFKWKICQFIKAFKIEFDCFKFEGIQECVWILILVATFIQGKMISHSSSFLSKLKSSNFLHCRFPHICNKKSLIKTQAFASWINVFMKKHKKKYLKWICNKKNLKFLLWPLENVPNWQ